MLIIVAVVLAVPVLPFLVLGSAFEDRIESWLQGEMSTGLRFCLIVSFLAADILLPVPSSMVSTYGGGVIGMWPAAAASWIGMTLGASLGFLLARLFGRRFAERKAATEDLERMESVVHRFGPTALFLTRPLPILAEACVLLVGATGLSWMRFLVPVAIANLAISITYAAFGEYFRGKDALPAAVIVSGLLPLFVALLARRMLPAGETTAES